MNKKEIISFFDKMAPDWDSRLVVDIEKISFILDRAGIKENCTVLDVACGTGVLFPYYLRRNVSRVIGVDISPNMTRLAVAKNRDVRVEVICADIEELPVGPAALLQPPVPYSYPRRLLRLSSDPARSIRECRIH